MGTGWKTECTFKCKPLATNIVYGSQYPDVIRLMLFTKKAKKFDPNVNMSDAAGAAKFFKKQHQCNIQSDALSTSGAFFR